MRNARKTLILILEIAAVVLVLLDVGLGLSTAWIRSRLQARGELLAGAQRHVFEEQARVANLERSQALLPAAQGQLTLFRSNHLSPRRQAFARLTGLLRELSEQSGVELTGVAYKLDTKRDTPFDRLGLEVGVQGPFPNLVRFGHALETSSDFIVARNFTFTHGEGGKLGLRLAADVYMTP